MKINFSKEDLQTIISHHLKSQGFNMKHKTVEIGAKARHLGKGNGWDVTVTAEVIDLEEPDSTTETEEPIVTGPIFEGSD
jgi:hypothetical protein